MGTVILGALEYLVTIDPEAVTRVDHFVGTSVGALISFMLVAGESLADVIRRVRNNEFMNVVPDVAAGDPIHEFGIDSGTNARKYIRSILAAHQLNAKVTLAQLFETTGKKLTVCVSEILPSPKVIFYNHETHPDESVVKVVYASMAIPIFYHPWREGACVRVDGGFFCNLPVGAVGDASEMLAFRIVPGSSNANSLTEYMTALLFAQTAFLEKQSFDALDEWIRKRLIVTFQVQDLGQRPAMDFEMDDERFTNLMSFGAVTTRCHLLHLRRDTLFVMQYLVLRTARALTQAQETSDS